MNYNLQKNLSHFGFIFLKFSILGLIFSIGILFSNILVVLIFLILIIVGIFSLFTLFFNNQYRELFNITESFRIFMEQANSLSSLFAGITLGLSFISLIFMLPDYKNRQTRKALLLCFFIILISFLFLIYGISRGN